MIGGRYYKLYSIFVCRSGAFCNEVTIGNFSLSIVYIVRFKDMVSSRAKEATTSTAICDKRSTGFFAPLDPQVKI